MVTENQQPEQAPVAEAAPPSEDIAPEPQNPILNEIEKLNAAPDIDIEESGPDAEATTEEPQPTQTEGSTVTPQPVAETPPQAEPAPQEPQPVPQFSPQQVQQLQQQAAEYERLRQQATIQNETQRYQRQLEAQGYAPEQAQQATQQHMQSRNTQQSLMAKADEYGQHIVAKVNASEHFAQKYELQMGDLAILRQAENPQVMEELAKKISGDRKMQGELAQLRKAQVPPQQFDSSQGEPQVASSDDSWLDRYNAGDRSPNATAAAKRILGMG